MVYLDAAAAHGDRDAGPLLGPPNSAGSQAGSDAVQRRTGRGYLRESFPVALESAAKYDEEWHKRICTKREYKVIQKCFQLTGGNHDLILDLPSGAGRLFKAFQRAKENAYERLNDTSPYKISLAWFRGPVEEQREILGDDPWPYGLEKNRHVVAALMDYLYEQGLVKEKLEVEKLFAPNTLDL